MTIASLVATGGAPVSVSGISPLTGFNTVWISGDGGEVIRIAVGGGQARFDDLNGDTSKTLILDADGQGSARICFKASANGPGAAVFTAIDASQTQWRRVLSFAPLVPGPGKFLWYGVATGARAGGAQYGSVFVAIDQDTDPWAMFQVASRATGTGRILVGNAIGDGKIQPIGADGCAEIRLVDQVPEAVTARLSLPQSADGEVLFVNCHFIANWGLANTLARLPRVQTAAWEERPC